MMARDFDDLSTHLKAHSEEFPRIPRERLPTEFVWRDPTTIPPRPWVYGRHLIRKQVSVTVAPGGVGKSSLTICEALAMTSERKLLGEWMETHFHTRKTPLNKLSCGSGRRIHLACWKNPRTA